MRKTSQATKVISALQSADYTDSGLTANEMKNKFGVSRYRLGTASRAVIAAGYKAIAAGLVATS